MNKRVYFKHLGGSRLSKLRDVLLCLSVLAPLGLTAQPNIAETFRILPIFDALTGSYPTDQFVAEANRLKGQVGQNRTNFKVGFSFIYPGLASTRRYCQIAQTNNISLGVILAQQTHSLSSTIANIARTDFRDYAWRLDGVTWEGAVGTNGSPLYPSRDYRTVTPSRYCTDLRNSYESTVRNQAREIVSLLQEFPGVLAVVNACIEEELASGGEVNDNYLADYSPFAVTEYRDWLRHTKKYDDLTGQYAGQGAPEAIVGTFLQLAGALRSPFYDDPDPSNANGTGQSFNARFGTSFTTWALRYWDLNAYPASITSTNFDPSPESGTGFTAGGFDPPRVRNTANDYWRAWSWDYQDQGSAFPPGNPSQPAFGFRQVLVRNFVNDLLGWCASEGVPAELLYAHQIPTEQVSTSRNRSSASPIWTGLLSLNQQLGITRFGSLNVDQLQQYSRNWGIFEWHPAPGSAPNNPSLYTTTLAHLDTYYWNGARVLFPGWWRQTGDPVDPTFPLPDSLFAQGLHDWLAARPDAPLPSMGTGAGLAGDYFANTNLAGPVVLQRVDGVINFNWAGASPGPGLSGNNFSVRWSGWVQPRYSETYTFYTTSDDGVRLWVNGQQLINDWAVHGATERSGTLALAAGQFYDLRLEYFQGTGGSSAQLAWSSATQPKQIISRSQLYPPVRSNAPPVVSLLAPGSATTFTTNAFSLTAYATDLDGSVAGVEFLANGVVVGQASAPPYVFSWTNVPPGMHQLTARATDDAGLAASGLPVLVTVFPPDTNLVSTGSVWKYNDTGANLGTAWRMPGYNDSAWPSGPAELGYGDLPEGRPEATVLCCSNAASKFITYYFRRIFTVADPTLFTSLNARLLRDDGAVVYLNGLEVWRSNMPTGTVSYLTLAPSGVSSTDEYTYFTTTLSPSSLRAGTNLIAIEVHQNSTGSSDLSFDFALAGRFGTPVPSQLTWSRTGPNLTLAWPFGVPVVQLFETTNLTPPVSWSAVGGAPLFSDGRWVQSLSAGTNGQRFFTLQPP
jgi:hypothetical protein